MSRCHCSFPVVASMLDPFRATGFQIRLVTHAMIPLFLAYIVPTFLAKNDAQFLTETGNS